MVSDFDFLPPSSSSSPSSSVFRVRRPSFLSWFFIISLSFVLQVGWFFVIGEPRLFVFLVTGFIVLLSVFVWGRFGSFFTRVFVLSPLRSLLVSRSRLGFFRRSFLFLLGLRFRSSDHYYLESSASHLNLNNFVFLVRDRLFYVTSTCLGIGFLIASAISPFISDIGDAIAVSSLIVLGAPLLAGFIVPVLWQLQDIRLKQISSSHEVTNLYDSFRHGIFSRVLGFSGLFAGLGFLINVLPDVFTKLNTGPEILSSIRLYLLSLLILLIISLLIAGTALLTVVLYLSLFHEQRVRSLRADLESFIPTATTIATIHSQVETPNFSGSLDIRTESSDA